MQQRQQRDWLYVEDHSVRCGHVVTNVARWVKTYNISGHNERKI